MINCQKLGPQPHIVDTQSGNWGPVISDGPLTRCTLRHWIYINVSL